MSLALQYFCLVGCDAMYLEKSLLSLLNDGNNRVLRNVGAHIPYYTVSNPEDCVLHSRRSENSNLIGLLCPLVRQASVFVFVGTGLVLLLH